MALLSEGILHRMILEEYERSGEITCLLVGDVHDAILFQVRADKVDYWIRIIKNTMENLPLEQFGFKPDIPILTEPKVGARWGKLDEYNFEVAA
jgi:DNA polymerase I-like protein with 3'-5' exonuclease and polymerase domains